MIPPCTPDQLQEMLDASPAVAFMGLRMVSADPVTQEVAMHAPMRPEFERGRGTGQWHGGPIAAIIDTVGDFALEAELSGEGKFLRSSKADVGEVAVAETRKRFGTADAVRLHRKLRVG